MQETVVSDGFLRLLRAHLSGVCGKPPRATVSRTSVGRSQAAAYAYPESLKS